MRCRAMVLLMLPLLAIGCSTDKKKRVGISAKLRSTGVSSSVLGLQYLANPSLNLTASMLANSAVKLDSYKVPVGRINLVTGLSGSGYSEASPNFYTCPSSTADECLVDLVNSDLDSLLANSGVGELEVSDSKSYDGVAVEFCPEGAAGPSNSYNIKLTGSVMIGSTTYYTNATSGLSTTSPAEEVSISVGCTGMTTPLLSPVTLGPDSSVNLVLYADPNGSVIGTTYKSLVNSNCKGEESLAICTSRASIFATVDDAKPSVERYKLEVTSDSGSSTPSADLLLTVLFNSSDAPVGASIQEYYANQTLERNLHSNSFVLSGVTKNADGTISVKYFDSGDILSNISRTSTTTGIVMSQLVDHELTLSSTKL